MGQVGRIASAVALGWSVAGARLAGTVRFVVAERPSLAEHGDSFVLPLTNPADVAHARALFELGPDVAGQPVVFAEVLPGGDGVNRDVLADGEPVWNWHVGAFEGFGDGGIELVDGWPASSKTTSRAGWPTRGGTRTTRTRRATIPVVEPLVLTAAFGLRHNPGAEVLEAYPAAAVG